MDFSITYQEYFGSIIPDTFLSSSQNVFLSFFGTQNSGTLTDNSSQLVLDETVSIDGNNFTYKGFGSAQPGVDVLGVILPLGLPVDVLLFEEQSTGQLFLAYPNGPPNILGALALTLDIDPVGYNLASSAPICFVRGTEILTPDGVCEIQNLEKGDQVLSFEGEAVEIVWAGRVSFSAPVSRWAPIVFEADSLGSGRPQKRLKVSPWHRMPLPDCDSTVPQLAPAKAFTVLPRVRHAVNIQNVHYHHILTQRHTMVIANGQPAETMFPGLEALFSVGTGPAQEILECLGCSEKELLDHPAAQPCGVFLKVSAARAKLGAMAKNQREIHKASRANHRPHHNTHETVKISRAMEQASVSQ